MSVIACKADAPSPIRREVRSSPLDLSNSRPSSDARGLFVSEPPWKAKAVILAGMAALLGLTGWISDMNSSALTRIGGSYIAGFFIGWAFRRFVKLVLVVDAFTIAGMALMKNVGWFTTDWGTLKRHITHNLAAIQEGAEGVKQLLTGYLPSAGAAAAGVVLGFRKK